MNETVDLSLAVSWPDYKLAWCAKENYECTPPDQIVEVTGNMHKYHIDPAIFKYGTYYRWDGKWNRAENLVAFTIVNGNRSSYDIFQSEESALAPGKIVQSEGPFKYYIARGDNPMVSTRLNRTDNCYLWAFTNTIDILGKQMIPIREGGGYTSYAYTFAEHDIMNMTIDTYPGYITCAGPNRVIDVHMNGDTMTTPYKAAKDVELYSWNPYNIKEKYDLLSKSIPDQMYDDVVYHIEIIVAEPYVAITNIERDDDDKTLFISGITSWENQTKLTFKLDPDNYKLPTDIRLHTWDTFTSGSIDAPRTFSTALSLEKNELSVGMHEIIANVDKNTDVGFSVYSFRVSDIKVNPTPTPSIKRILQTEDRSEIPVRTTATPSVTAEITKAYSTTNATENVVVEMIQTTADSTPVQTTPTPVPTKTTPVVIPLSILVSIASLIIASMVMKR